VRAEKKSSSTVPTSLVAGSGGVNEFTGGISFVFDSRETELKPFSLNRCPELSLRTMTVNEPIGMNFSTCHGLHSITYARTSELARTRTGVERIIYSSSTVTAQWDTNQMGGRRRQRKNNPVRMS
jgi:hypothetical protein